MKSEQRTRVERLVAEETRAMMVRLIRKMDPGLPAAAIERGAAAASVALPASVRLTDAEIEMAAASDDDGVRAGWRAAFEGPLAKMFAAEMPS